MSGFEQLPFLFVAAKEGFKDDTGGFEGPKEPSAPLGGGKDGFGSTVVSSWKRVLHGRHEGEGGTFALFGVVPVEGFVSVGLWVAEGVEVEFDD